MTRVAACWSAALLACAGLGAAPSLASGQDVTAVRMANAQAFAVGTDSGEEIVTTAGALLHSSGAEPAGTPVESELAASAQARRRQARARRPAAPRGPAVRVQAFGEVGWEFFAASKTFDAVLGSKSGIAYGG